MAKVHPHKLASSASTSSKQEVFTLWMKSLILSSNGCVAFDSNGQIVYRVDNYDKKCSNKVYIMDFKGKVLFTIVKKKFSVLGMWEGYRADIISKKATGFSAKRKLMGFLSGKSLLKVVVGLNKDQSCEYVVENQMCKSSCKIIDNFGGLVAEVKRKITTSGVVLDEDVLTMVVEPHIDHSLIMGLVVVFGLINHKL
ncbi:hypothetical protein ACJIZ3_021092 [Penstemon smallii]|uniref:Protein LURP-one-related 11 n=1 Tax=Penstemon smallii TaxID=265156 RepID=A0ABD3SL52_9LAMI